MTSGDPHARHDTYREPRPRATSADLERDIARTRALIAAPDWHHGLHPERSRAWLARLLEVVEADLAREVERAEAQWARTAAE